MQNFMAMGYTVVELELFEICKFAHSRVSRKMILKFCSAEGAFQPKLVFSLTVFSCNLNDHN